MEAAAATGVRGVWRGWPEAAGSRLSLNSVRVPFRVRGSVCCADSILHIPSSRPVGFSFFCFLFIIRMSQFWAVQGAGGLNYFFKEFGKITFHIF